MEPVSGFISFDGKFFTSSDACRAYEERVTRMAGFAGRCQEIVEGFATGTFLSKPGLHSSSLPKELIAHLSAIPEDDLIDLWNEHLIHLFLNANGDPEHEKIYSCLADLRCTTTEPEGSPVRGDALLGFYVLKAETAYKLLAFVLDK